MARGGPNPSEQLLVILTEAKAGGVPFDEIWQLALYGPRKDSRRIKFPHDTTERRQWRAALEATQPSWKLAYLDQPDRGGEIVEFLFKFLNQGGQQPQEAAEVRREALAV